MPRKNTFFCFILLSSSIAGLMCKSKKTSTSQQEQYKDIYIDQFKLTFFRQVLIKSYNNSAAIQEIINSDNSGFAEPILTTSDYKLIDSLTSVENDKIKIDSVQGNKRTEGAQGKRPFRFILEKLESKWLDSLANERYKTSGVKEDFRD